VNRNSAERGVREQHREMREVLCVVAKKTSDGSVYIRRRVEG